MPASNGELSFTRCPDPMKTNRDVSVITPIIVAALLAFSSPATASGGLDLSAHEGKVVVVDFWASWCVPCRRSFPWLNDMHARYADQGLVIIGVNLDTDRDDAMAFLAEYPADFHIHFDAGAGLAKDYGVEAMPSSFVIGRDGQVKARHLGFKVKRTAEYEAILVEALGAQP